jgi:hypothetical protein
MHTKTEWVSGLRIDVKGTWKAPDESLAIYYRRGEMGRYGGMGGTGMSGMLRQLDYDIRVV